MTTQSESTMVDVTDDLEAFSAELYGTTPPPAKEDAREPQPEDQPVVDPEPEGDDGDDEGDTSEEDNPEPEAEKPPERKKRTTAERVKALNANWREAQREAAELRARLDAIEAGQKKPLTEETASDNTAAVQAPDPAKYKFGELDPQYMADLVDYRAELKIQALLTKQEEARRAEAEASQATTAEAKVRETVAKVTEAGTAKFPDFQTVVVEAAENGEFALTQEMFETAVETAVAADILYHLAQNPEESAQVAAMNPRQQALWFGRMEAKLSAPRPAPKKITQAGAPPPSFPKGNAGKGGVNLTDLDDPRALDAMTQALFGKA